MNQRWIGHKYRFGAYLLFTMAVIYQSSSDPRKMNDQTPRNKEFFVWVLATPAKSIFEDKMLFMPVY